MLGSYFSVNNYNAKQIKSESDDCCFKRFLIAQCRNAYLTAVGYAVVSSQPGRTDAQKDSWLLDLLGYCYERVRNRYMV